MIIQYNKVLTEEFLNNKFANKYQGDARTLRIGNIVSFISPVEFLYNYDEKKYISNESINFCLEIPDINNYSGACFQKLFITLVANTIANNYIKADIEVKNNDIIIKKEHKNCGINQLDGIVSLSHIKNINNTILIYLGLYNHAGEKSQPRSFSLELSIDKCNQLMDTINESFYYLANSIFLLTSKMLYYDYF